MAKSNLIDLTVILKHETDKAYLVADEENLKGVWIPKSQCEIDKSRDPYVIITVTEFIARDKGLI